MTTKTNWELAYRYKAAEMEALGRHGSEHGHRTLRWWHRSDRLPLWLMVVWEPVTARICCLAHGHTPFTEMDGYTIVCAICARPLGKHDWRRDG